MDNYWKQLFDNNVELFKGQPYQQVGKTVNGIAVNAQQLMIVAENVVNLLHLTAPETVFDLCCGNGLITELVAQSVNKVIAVDFSAGLIATAKGASTANNIDYLVGDVPELSSVFFQQASKCYLYDALAFFSSAKFAQLLTNLAQSGMQRVMIGCVPDQEKIWDYYDTDEKKQFYWQREEKNQPHMGKWWGKNEVADLAAQYGYKVQFFNQPPALVTAYYRFDCLLQKETHSR